MQPQATVARSQQLDAVRGIAILLILGGHYFAPAIARRIPVFGEMSFMMWVGVDLFFVLSGFLLGGILIRNREAQSYFLPFYGRRALRILPLYAVCIGLFLLSDAAKTQNPWTLILFVQNIEWGFGNGFGPLMIAPTWSLAVEEQFYLVLPFLIRYCPPRLLPAVLLALIAAAPLIRAMLQSMGYPHATYLLMPARMDSLFLGVLIAWANIQPIALNRKYLACAAVAGGFGFLVMLFSNRDMVDWWMSVVGYSVIAAFFAACFTLLVTAKRPLAGWPVKALAPIGLGAYSIYLFHMPILIASVAYFGQSLRALGAATIFVFLIAWASWRWVERPAIALGHRVLKYGTRRGPPLGL